MKYPITEYDKELLLQHSLHFKIKVTVTNLSRNIVDILYGITNIGTCNIDSESNIRRTFHFSLKLDDFIENIESKIASWIGLYYEVEIGVLDERTDNYVYYPNGRFLITDASTIYDSTNNTISFNLSDRMSELEGTRNGQIGGAPIIEIPQIVNEVKQTIRGTVINLLTSSTNVDKYIIEDIGEFYGMPQNNEDYLEYRKNNEDWNILPYDLTYSSGDYIGDMLFDIRDLYPNCQMYFDVYDNFCFNMIPSLENDLPDLDFDYIEKVLVAENSETVDYDVASIKNVTEIFGKSYDIDRYCETSSYENNIYILTLENYESYKRYDMIAFTPSSNNVASPYIRINSLDAIPLYYEYTTTPVQKDVLITGDMCVVRINKVETTFVAYYLGQYQPHALCVLTNNINDAKYTKSYFSQKYNVKEKNIVFREQPFSKFSVQMLGEILDSKAGDDFDNILSDSVAMQNSEYYNRLTSTMFDTVTITTILVPWLDVNVKINYKKAQENIVYSYVVKSRHDNFRDGTSTITMYRFQQLYE